MAFHIYLNNLGKLISLCNHIERSPIYCFDRYFSGGIQGAGARMLTPCRKLQLPFCRAHCGIVGVNLAVTIDGDVLLERLEDLWIGLKRIASLAIPVLCSDKAIESN